MNGCRNILGQNTEPQLLLMHSSECECVNEWLGEWLNEACSKKAQRQSREVPIHLSVKNRKNCYF